MLRADRVQVEWNPAKKGWEIHISIGEEVIKRLIDKHLTDTSETALKEVAVATARDEGYEVAPAQVTVVGHAGI